MPNKGTSQAKQRLIEQLTKKANKHHRQVKHHCQGLLDEAHLCGIALQKIRYKLRRYWRKVRWIRWCNDNLEFSYQTAKVYWRIASTWDKPEMVEARAKGDIRSIAAYMKILRLVQAGEKKQVSFSQFEASALRQEARRRFAEWLRTKTREESVTLERNIERYLEMIDPKLYDDTCIMLDLDLDEYLLEKSESKLMEWERKNRKRRRPYHNVPNWVIDLDMRRARVEEREKAHKKFTKKVRRSLNRRRKQA